jgi:hypothetical protein
MGAGVRRVASDRWWFSSLSRSPRGRRYDFDDSGFLSANRSRCPLILRSVSALMVSNANLFRKCRFEPINDHAARRRLDETQSVLRVT